MMHSLVFWITHLLASTSLCTAAPATGPAAATQPAAVHLTCPLDYQVFQENAHHTADVLVEGASDDDAPLELQITGGQLPQDQQGWGPLQCDAATRRVHFSCPLPAGGWYTLRVRERNAPGDSPVLASVAHVGVGEVFVVAGQSNSTNWGSQRQKVKSSFVSTFDGTAWRMADDPQPGVQDGSTNGSFVPAFGDALHEKLGVPIAVASVGCGATSVRQWLPKGSPILVHPTTDGFVKDDGKGKWICTGELFAGLAQRMAQLGPHGFAAVLWHQGESDAGQQRAGYPADRQIAPDQYAALMKQLIAASRTQAGWDVPWLIAQATYHSEGDPADAGFRDAQKSLWQDPGVFPGPDTDALTEKYRAGVHFNPLGLDAHGKQWADKVAAFLQKTGH